MNAKTMDDVLGNFSTAQGRLGTTAANRKPITVWVRPEVKDRYDSLQKLSGRTFSKKVPEVLLMLIEAAEAKAG